MICINCQTQLLSCRFGKLRAKHYSHKKRCRGMIVIEKHTKDNQKESKPFRVFSMFSGIGGFDEAFRREGHEVIGHSEIDKYADQVYSRHFSNRNYGDCTRIIPEELPDFDIICGGFPCQAFSIAGKRRGFEDTRGTLFFEIARIAKVKRPKYLLLENVKGLLNHDQGKTFGTIISALVELGYEVEYGLLNTRYFGIPQNRERVFIVASLGTGSCRKVFPIRQDCSEIKTELQELTFNVSDANRIYSVGSVGKGMSGQVDSPRGIARTIKGLGGGLGAKTGLYAVPVLTPDRLKKRQNGRRFKEDGEPSFTLNTHDRQGVMIPEATKKGYAVAEEGDSINLCAINSKTRRGRVGKQIAQTIDTSQEQYTMQQFRIRRLTPTECERLQGFDDGWTEGISDSQRYKCLGNALTVKVAQTIIQKLI